MAATSGIQYGSGFRYGVAYALNANGRIAGTSATVPYQGVPFTGAKAWNLTIPKQRRLHHINNDRVGAADFLPPTEAASATLGVSADNQVIDAILMANKQSTTIQGEASVMADLTSNQGFEPIIALFLYQQALDYSSRLRRWRSFAVPRAKAITMPSGYADREVDGTYDVLMTPSNFDIFGRLMTVTDYGATDAQLFRYMTEGIPSIMAFVGDGATVLFSFPAGQTPAKSTAKVAVFVNGTLTTTGTTVTTTGVTFTVAPVAGADITIWWEY